MGIDADVLANVAARRLKGNAAEVTKSRQVWKSGHTLPETHRMFVVL